MAAEEKLFIKENTLELLAKVSYILFSTPETVLLKLAQHYFDKKPD